MYYEHTGLLTRKSNLEYIMLHGKWYAYQELCYLHTNISSLYLGLAYEDPPNRAEVTLAGKIIFYSVIVVVFETCK
jgi:hypothetical protein